jgi:large subunit ribosomal protein L22
MEKSQNVSYRKHKTYMIFQATAKYIRMSPRKIRIVADSIRKMKPDQAVLHLSQLPKNASKPLGLVISSALANARQNNAQIESLRFSKIEIMEGPSLKRWRAVSRGSAHTYKKRMTHIRIMLCDDVITHQDEHPSRVLENAKKRSK